MLRGVPTRPPRLPRSWRSRTILKLEAKHDRRVRTAYEAASAAEQARQLKPKILVRDCGTIIGLR